MNKYMTKEELQKLRKDIAKFFSIYGMSDDDDALFKEMMRTVKQVLEECGDEDLPTINN